MAPDPFDLEQMRLPASDLQALLSRSKTKPPRHRPGEPFLRGPIPWRWLTLAARLRGSALHVGLTLWRESGIRKNRTLPFCLSHLAPMGLGVQAARRGLRALELARLVTVERSIGCGLKVTLQELPPTSP
jgi:hypothetical protein